MIATSTYKTAFFKHICLTILMVIITLPGTHLLANDNLPMPVYKTHVDHLQLSNAIKEAGTRIKTFLNSQEPAALEIEISLLSSADMNFHLAGFVPKNKAGKPAILINANWLSYGMTDEALVRLILEGTGSLMEYHQKGQITKGGMLMANELSNIYKDADMTPLKADAIQLNGTRTVVYFQ
jgi:hypothetical protein